MAYEGEKGERGHVDPTISDPGVEHAVNVEKSGEREEHAKKKQECCGGAAPAALKRLPSEE